MFPVGNLLTNNDRKDPPFGNTARPPVLWYRTRQGCLGSFSALVYGLGTQEGVGKG